MNRKFKIFEDKLNINIEAEPNIDFGHIGLKDQDENYKGEFFVFSYSYMVSKKEVGDRPNDNTLLLDMDLEMDNFVKVFSSAVLTDMGQSSSFYNFISAKKPLISLEKYIKILEHDTGFEELLKDFKDDEDNEEGFYVRIGLSVCFPDCLSIDNEVAIRMGMDFMDNFDMEDLDIPRIQELYNKRVEERQEKQTSSLFSSNTYYFYLDNLGSLLDMPFNSKGKVYQNNIINEPKYIYETDTMLFDFLDEFNKNPILLREMNVVVKDVSKLVETINKK